MSAKVADENIAAANRIICIVKKGGPVVPSKNPPGSVDYVHPDHTDYSAILSEVKKVAISLPTIWFLGSS